MGCPCIFGEVLFDCFPGGERVLGGAPFNVAWHLQAFGESPEFISRVGSDTDGIMILEGMLKWGMRTDGVLIDGALPTGRVDIVFGEDGEPAYDIIHPSAYDAIAPIDGGRACDLIYHGSLALREQQSRKALLDLKSRVDAPVFVDVNLRSPWWKKELVEDLLEGADWVKLNGDELKLLAPNCKPSEFVSLHRLQGLILTHGADGAEIVSPDSHPVRVQPRKNMPVVDTVGAGDAFASVMLLGLLNEWPLQQTAERAQDFASRMVGQRGATVSDMHFYQGIMAGWNDARQQEF